MGGRPNYGPTAQERTKRLLEALLAYAHQELEDCEHLKIEANWQAENQLVVRTKVRFLEELTAKYEQDGRLDKAQIKEALNRLKDWLEILEDNRTKTQGSEDWHFTLKLWSKDKQENLKRFELEWKRRKAKKSQPTAPKDPNQPKAGIDWQLLCRAMLEAQNQGRLTTNPLTTGEGVAFALDEIYVPLGLVQRKQQHRVGGDVSPEKGSHLYEPEVQDEIIQTFQQDEFFEQVLRLGQSKRIAIIGEPGAGKTTLLQKIAAWVLDNTSDVPIWISLADLQGKTLDAYLLQDWLKAAIRKVRVTEAMQEALGDLFNSGRVWLLLDGVDEMTVGTNTSGLPLQAIAQQIQGWVSDARVVLTCRLNVWDAGKNALEAFDTYRNLDFSYGDAQTPDQVGQFIRRWFKDDPVLGVKRSYPAGNRLRAELDQSGRERIKDAVKNPLRLALLCRTWALGQGGLPNTKAGLYQQFTEALYEWKQDRFPTTSNQRQELNKALGELALRAIAQEKTKFRLRYRLVDSVLGKPDADLFKLALQLGWLNQVGVAAEAENRGEKVYAFYHPTFQEYFAAQAISDWHYFLNHVPHDPAQGTYRIFEPQWKEVILLWLGREDVPNEQKEDFIKALVEFEDGCKVFYKYRAYFLAASGIAEFGNCSIADKIVAQIVKWGFGYFSIEKQDCLTFPKPIEERARATLAETARPRATAALVQLIKSTQDEYTRWLAADSLGKIAPSNQTAIAALVQLIESTQNESTRWLAADSLEGIGTGNQTVIAALLQIIESNEYEYIRQQAADSLGEIGTVNSTAIAGLVQLIESSQDEDTRWLAVETLGQIGTGNPTAITALVQLIESSKDEFTLRQAADSLGKIDPGNPAAIAGLVQLIESSKDEDNRRLAADRLGKIDPGNEIALGALVQLIESTDYEYIRQEAAESLGKIGTGNQIAIAGLVQLIESAEYEDTRRLAVDSLGKIDPGNQIAIAGLVQLIESAEDEDTRRLAVDSLGKIGTGNQIAIASLVQLIKSTEYEDTRWQAADSLGKIDPGNPTAITGLLQLIESTEDEYTRWQAADSLEKIDPANPKALAALLQLIESTKNKFTRRLAADSLGKISTGNQTAIAGLVQLIESTEYEYIRQQAADSLGEIGTGNQTAITALAELIKLTENESTCRKAAYSLGKIDPGNPTAIAALVQLIKSAEDKSTRMQAADSLGEIGTGNETALAALVQLIESADDEFTRRQAAESLKTILRDDQLALIVTALKDYLSDETYKNDFERLHQCYRLIWHCAQNMPYPAFYQAWHTQPTSSHPVGALKECPPSETTGVGSHPISQSLNLASLPQNLATAIANNPQLSQTIHLICIDASKFIDPDNPAAEIYIEMVQQGCPERQQGEPATMQALKVYWKQLKSDKRVVLVFYENPTGYQTQGFSQSFLCALSKFDGAIAVVTSPPTPLDPPSPPYQGRLTEESHSYSPSSWQGEEVGGWGCLQCFSGSQPLLVEDIVGWIKANV